MLRRQSNASLSPRYREKARPTDTTMQLPRPHANVIAVAVLSISTTALISVGSTIMLKYVVNAPAMNDKNT